MPSRSGKPKHKQTEGPSTRRNQQPSATNPTQSPERVQEGSHQSKAGSASSSGQVTSGRRIRRPRNDPDKYLGYAMPVEPDESLRTTVAEYEHRIDDLEKQLEDLSGRVASRRGKRSKKMRDNNQNNGDEGKKKDQGP